MIPLGKRIFEEFFTDSEVLNLSGFEDIGIIKNKAENVNAEVQNFTESIDQLKEIKNWNKMDLVNLFNETLPEFNHMEKGKNLENRM